MKRSTRTGEAGFTLLELIVAAGILALIAVFSWRGLDALIREREAIATSQATVDVLQRSFARIERDALLARDVQLDGAGTLRLTAGTTSADDADPVTVEYRVQNNALTRTVVGVDPGPLTLIDGVTAVAMEAWTPAPRGGAWVRTKAAASEPPPPTAPGAAPGTASPGAPGAPGTVPQTPGQPVPPAPLGTTLPATQPAAQAGAAPPGPAVATIPAATGVRLTIALANGTQIVRAFMIGGA